MPSRYSECHLEGCFDNAGGTFIREVKISKNIRLRLIPVSKCFLAARCYWSGCCHCGGLAPWLSDGMGLV